MYVNCYWDGAPTKPHTEPPLKSGNKLISVDALSDIFISIISLIYYLLQSIYTSIYEACHEIHHQGFLGIRMIFERQEAHRL